MKMFNKFIISSLKTKHFFLRNILWWLKICFFPLNFSHKAMFIRHDNYVQKKLESSPVNFFKLKNIEIESFCLKFFVSFVKLLRNEELKKQNSYKKHSKQLTPLFLFIFPSLHHANNEEMANFIQLNFFNCCEL